MSPARIAHGHNPLRAVEDKRLPRIAGPCGLVLFGVTGDLSRKKLMPAVYDLAEVLRGPVPAGEADEREARREQPAVGEVVDRRHELLARKVAGDAEDHHAAGTGDLGQSPVPAAW